MSAPAARARPAEASGRSPAPDALITFGLPAFVVGQPALDTLGAYPEVLLAHEVTHPDFLLVLAALFLGPGLALLLAGALFGRPPRGRLALSAALACGLTGGGFALQAVRTGGAGPAAAALGVLAAGAATGASLRLYRRAPAFRSFAAVAGGLTPAFLALFFSSTLTWETTSTEEGVALPEADPETGVVLLLLDELPLASLLDEEGEIDAARFPNLARLAEVSTWYRDTAATAQGTIPSMASVFTGRWPTDRGVPTRAEHPAHLLALFAPTHEFSVPGSFRYWCVGATCADAPLLERAGGLLADLVVVLAHRTLPAVVSEAALPSLEGRWDFRPREEEHGLARYRTLEENLAQLDGPLTGRLLFLRAPVPHRPWQWDTDFLRFATEEPLALVHQGDGEPPLAARRALVQSHLLQVGMTDRWVGRVLDRLESTGELDRVTLVVFSDHGVTLRGPGIGGRTVDAGLAGVLAVPLFVKAPGQREGAVCDEPAALVDILPLIAAEAGLALPGDVDGRRPCTPPRPGARERFATIDGRGVIEVGELSAASRALSADLREVAPGADLDEVRRAGPRQDLLGHRLGAGGLVVGPASALRAELDVTEPLGTAQPERRVRATFFYGRLSAVEGRPPPLVVVTRAGVVAGVLEPFPWTERELRLAGHLVPELLAGEGALALYELGPDDELRPIACDRCSPR